MDFKIWLAQHEELEQFCEAAWPIIKHHFSQIGMPRGKLKHSKRTLQIVKNANKTRDAWMAAAFHDYLERGGDIETAKSEFSLSDRATNIIRHLSDTEGNEEEINNAPLSHMKSILSNPSIPDGEKEIVILIKIADRLDNLYRRIRSGGVGKNYAAKSQELLQFLFVFYYQNYGKDKSIKKMFARYKEIDVQIKAKRQLNLTKPWKASVPTSDLDQ